MRNSRLNLLAALATISAISLDAGFQESRVTTERVPSVSSLAALKARTPDQIERAKYFDSWGSEPLVPGYETRQIVTPPSIPPGRGTPKPYSERLSVFICGANAAAVGKPVAKTVLLNQGGTFLFTDYELTVEQWVEPSSGPFSTVVSMAGGEVLVNGRRVAATEAGGLTLESRYLLVLHRIGNAATLSSLTPYVLPVPIIDDVPNFPRSWPTVSSSQRTAMSLDDAVRLVRNAFSTCKSGDLRLIRSRGRFSYAA